MKLKSFSAGSFSETKKGSAIPAKVGRRVTMGLENVEWAAAMAPEAPVIVHGAQAVFRQALA